MTTARRRASALLASLTGLALLAASVTSILGAEPALVDLEFLHRSDDYRVWINGQEQFVFKSLKTGNHGSHDIASMSFLSFDLHAPAEIKVEPRAKVASFALRPFNLSFAGTVASNVITFRMDRPQHVVVTVNDSYNPVLVLSAKPPHTPPKPAEVTRYFAPGLHDIAKHLPLKSDDKVYLAEGAIVKGGFAISNASNVSITGRGIIYNGHYPHEEAFRVFKGDGTKDVLIEGITVCNSPGWIVSFWNGNTNLTVRDVTMVGNWWMNSDGVQTGTKGLLVENCFMQCNDDNFSLNGVCRDVVIRNNVLWNLFNGGVFMLGWATGQQSELAHLDIRDNVILRAGGCCDYDRKAPISMKLFGSRRSAEDVRVRNLVIEDLAPYGRWIDIQAGKATRSTLRDFTFENIEVLKTWKVEGELRGNSDGCVFDNVVFKDIRIAGKTMKTPADGGLNLIQTKGVTIQGQPFADAVSIEPDPKPEAGQQQARVPASIPTVSRASPNLLVNPSFEEGLRGWTTEDSAHCKLVSGDKSASHGTNAVRITKRGGGQNRVEQDVTEVLRNAGPGDFAWGARVRGSVAGITVKATIVIEADGQTQQHPAPDAATLVEEWTKTERRTPLKWTALLRATLRIESTWGENGQFYVDECWLSQ